MMDNKTANGILAGNPLFRLGLGLCPALAVTTCASTALGMGVATACVLLLSSLAAFALGKIASEKGAIATWIMVTACFATLAQFILKGWFPTLAADLGIFVPLIAVSSLLMSRADFAACHSFGTAMGDALGMGIGYIVAMTLVGVVREILGRGTLFGADLLPFTPVPLAALPAGGFIVVGLLMGCWNALMTKKNGKEETRA